MKKIIALFLVLASVIGMTACSTNKSLTLNITTGDEIKVTCDTSEDYDMKWDGDDSELTVKNDDEKILELVFAEGDALIEEMELMDGLIKIEEDDEENGVRYLIFTAPDSEDEDVCYIAGWIVGSDTGIYAQGTDSKKETLKALQALTFEVEDTDQDDDDYYPDIFDDIEEYDPDAETPDEPEEPDVTEPEVTEPEVTEPEQPSEPEEPVEPSEPDEPEEPVEGMSEDWKDFTVSYDGKVMKMPISYKEFKELTGLTMKSAEEKSYLEPNYYTVVNMRNADGDTVCNISVLNNTDEDATYADCIIIEISQYDSHLDHGPAIVFSGLKIGDVTSKADLLDKYGEPTKIYEYRIKEDDDQSWKKYETDTYTWSMDKDWTTRDNIEIVMNINTGIIEEISMDFSGLVD